VGFLAGQGVQLVAALSGSTTSDHRRSGPPQVPELLQAQRRRVRRSTSAASRDKRRSQACDVDDIQSIAACNGAGSAS
jgi:hypothetical protein